MTEMTYNKRYKMKPSQQPLISSRTIRNIYIVLAIVVIGIAVTITVRHLRLDNNPDINSYQQLASLKNYIFNDSSIVETVTQKLQEQTIRNNFYVVFISISDIAERARVFTGTGESILEAWDTAERATISFIEENEYNLIWAKVDIVDSMERVPATSLNNYVVSTIFQNFFRKGISLDNNFNIAFLESEISGNKLIRYYTESEVAANDVDYGADLLHLQNINYYLNRWQNKNEISKNPDEIIIFTTEGLFCDENYQVYDLYNEGMGTGRRKMEMMDDNYLESIVLSASEYLYDLIQPSGKFTYGYYPVFNNWMTSYNNVRHASSLWSLINLYRMCLSIKKYSVWSRKHTALSTPKLMWILFREQCVG